MGRKIVLSESQFNRLISEITSGEIEERVKDVNLHPSEAQKEAENYKKGHISIKGMAITIETPKGKKRYWKDSDGKTGSTKMNHHYGYFRSTRGNGKDGDAVDVFVGKNTENFTTVYVVDQKINGKFDESKVMLGFNSKDEAKQAYLSNYSEDWKGFMYISAVSIPIFKKWLYRGNKQQKPFRDYVLIQRNKKRESHQN